MATGKVIGGDHINAMVVLNLRGDLALRSGIKRLPKLTPDFVAQWSEATSESTGTAAAAVRAVGKAVARSAFPAAFGRVASAVFGATVDATVRSPRIARIDWLDGTQSLIKLPAKLFTHFELILEDQRAVIAEPELDPEVAEALVMQPPDVVEQLARLAALRDQGVLTEVEFTTKKTELLGRI